MKGFSNLLLNRLVGLYINLLSFININKATRLSYAFFSEPKNGKLSKKKLPQILQESQIETFYHNGQTIQSYIWKGNETVILLAHGWESNSSRWKKMLPFLRKTGSTVVALDAPAHGLSSGTEFNLFNYAEFIHIVAKKFNPSYLIGHSLGGQASLYYQFVYQNENLKKIAILGTPCDAKIIFDNFIASFGLNQAVSKGFEDYFFDNFNIKIADFSGIVFASKIKTLGLIAHDLDDETVLFEEGKKIAASWKNSLFIKTKGIGHSMQDNLFYEKIATLLLQN